MRVLLLHTTREKPSRIEILIISKNPCLNGIISIPVLRSVKNRMKTESQPYSHTPWAYGPVGLGPDCLRTSGFPISRAIIYDYEHSYYLVLLTSVEFIELLLSLSIFLFCFTPHIHDTLSMIYAYS